MFTPYPSPLRYPGGKGRLANFVKALIATNSLTGGHYIEPYAGGASIAFSVLFEEYASEIHLNDIDRSVYAFWQSVLKHTDELCRTIERSPVTIDEWHRQKKIQTSTNTSLLQLGFSTFFLNRTNRSGILRGGVIGGKKQSGDWKLGVRFNKEDLIARIRRIARFRDRVHVYNLDALNFLQQLRRRTPPKSLLYLDPPYFIKGPGLYQHSYNMSDHAEISKEISRFPTEWIVSYDHHADIERLYQGFRSIRYSLAYTLQSVYRGQELMVFSDNLAVPSVESPAKVSLSESLDFEPKPPLSSEAHYHSNA